MPDNRDEQKEKNAPSENGPPPGGPGRPNGPEGNMRFSRSMLGWIVILATTILLFVVFRGEHKPETRDWSEFKQLIENGYFKSVLVKAEGDTYQVTGVPQSDAENRVVTHIPTTALDGNGWNQLTELVARRGKLGIQESNNLFYSLILPMLPYVLIFVLVWFFFMRQIRSAGGGIGMLGNFGRSRHRLLSKEHTNVTFNDVAGIEEAKEELNEIVEFLKNPKRFQRLGGRIPRGVLLIGDPGCGKTLLAKAIAGEADVPFFSISGSDFVEMFVGVGASRVRDLFKTAKESSPCIIFLDEIDAVGRRRGNGMASGGHDEREQTLNAILVEMDGFDTNDQVIVIAATNRADVLDPALTRPGRFDRQVFVPLPDIKGRYEILKVHARKVKLAASVDLMRMARQTPMFSGADLAAIINESALLATMTNKEAIEMADLEEARDKLKFGKARKSRVIDEKEKEILAWHEAGHAIINALQPDYEPLHKVTIIGRRGYGGASFSLPEKDRIVHQKKWMLANLRVCFGGRISEELFVGDISSGASSDIDQASHLARAMVCELGMSEALGPIKFAVDQDRNAFFPDAKEYSDKTAELIDSEVHRIVASTYEDARRILTERATAVAALKDALLKYETVDAEDVRRILAGETITKPTVAELLASEQQRRAEVRREEERRAPEPEGPALGIPQPG